MKIGYACISIGVPNSKKRTCKLRNATNVRLLEIIENNINALNNTIDYNIKNNILLFRIGSDLIPFGSSPVNNLKWWDIFKEEFANIGKKIINNNIRVSMHPGQYTVLNSPNNEVVERAIADLEYHNRVLDTLGVDSKHKLILHIGGIYNDRKKAKERFIKNYRLLSEKLKNRLIIENDDKSFTIADVLEISQKASIPVVYDNLHNFLNPSDVNKNDFYWIELCKKTWEKEDGVPKVHYSQQNPLKQLGSHSKTIILKEFLSFYNVIRKLDVDIMLEVKDKNLSALKCIYTINKTSIENEWKIYKYIILERSIILYYKINELIKDNDYSHQSFYTNIELALKMEKERNLTIIAINLIWDILKDYSNDKEKKKYANLITKTKNYNNSDKAIRNYLYKLASIHCPDLTYNLFFYDYL